MSVRRSVTRRRFLDASLRVGGAALAWRHRRWLEAAQQSAAAPETLIVHSARPQDLETPAHLLTSWIPPTDIFFVRSHFYTPTIHEDGWSLRVDGDVDTPLTLTLADIL